MMNILYNLLIYIEKMLHLLLSFLGVVRVIIIWLFHISYISRTPLRIPYLFLKSSHLALTIL